MRMKLIGLLMAVAAMLCTGTPAIAQTQQETKYFDQVVQTHTRKGDARIYMCSNAEGGYSEMPQHAQRLTNIARQMSAGDERVVAARFKCHEMAKGVTDAFFAENFIGQAAKDQAAVWLIGELTESHKYSTGNTFEGIVRIPLASRQAGAAIVPAKSVAAKADADYFRQYNTRTLAGTTEDGGYLVCPSAAAIDQVLERGRTAPLDRRDERMEGLLQTARCTTGKRLLTGIRVNRHVPSEGTEWYGATGMQSGKPVNVVVWLH